MGKRLQFRPPDHFFIARGEELPAQRARQSEPAVIGGAAAYSDQAMSGALLGGRLQERAQSLGVQFERVIFPRRQLGQADHAGGFNDRCFAFGMPPPGGLTRPMRRVHRFDGLQFCLKDAADDFAKAIAAVAHREQRQVILRPRSFPTRRYGLCRLVSGECALELVRADQNLQCHA